MIKFNVVPMSTVDQGILLNVIFGHKTIGHIEKIGKLIYFRMKGSDVLSQRYSNLSNIMRDLTNGELI